MLASTSGDTVVNTVIRASRGLDSASGARPKPAAGCGSSGGGVDGARVAASATFEVTAAAPVTAASEAVYLNVAARRLFASRRGLRLEGGFVGAGSPADERVLREAIARVAQADPQAGAAAPRVVSLASPPPAPPLVVVIRAAGQVFASQTGTRRGLALITVRGGSVGHDPATCSFAHQYTLTVAQAKVGALVFAGHPLAAMARALNVSENTVRSHLKQIYQKTDTHGQMELVHLHARVCSALP